MGTMASDVACMDSSEQVRAENNADLLLAVYASIHLTSVFFGIELLLFGTGWLLPWGEWHAFPDGCALVCGLAGLVTAFASALRLDCLGDYQARSKVLYVLLALVIASGALSVGAFLIPQDVAGVAMQCIACFVGVFALGISGLLSLDFACGFSRGSFAVCVCSSMVVGTFASCVCVWMGPLVSIVAFAAFSALGTAAALAYSKYLLDIDNPEKVPARQAFERMILNRKTGWFLVCYGAAFGIACVDLVAFAAFPGNPAQMVAAVSFVAGSAVAMLLLVRNAGKMLFGRAQRCVFPLLVVGLLPWGYLGGEAGIAALPWTFFASAVFLPFAFDTHCFLAKSYAIPPIYPLVMGFRSYVKGMAVGALAGLAVRFCFQGPSAAVLLHFVLLVALCIVVAFVNEEADRTDHVEGEMDNGCDEADATVVAGQEMASWEARAASMADEFGLTPREAEVLPLLFRANTTERISDILCISSHTAKTHIYHIYQKCGVSSRGELSDLFEERMSPRS